MIITGVESRITIVGYYIIYRGISSSRRDMR
jgi:hypothetical protein